MTVGCHASIYEQQGLAPCQWASTLLQLVQEWGGSEDPCGVQRALCSCCWRMLSLAGASSPAVACASTQEGPHVLGLTVGAPNAPM